MWNYFKQKLPNLLTISRVLAMPIIIFSFYIESQYTCWITISIFLFACITDFFDGYLARIWDVQSEFGKLFDPIADKLIVASTIIMLIYKQKIDNFTIIPSIIIVCREILVSGLREYSAIRIPVSKIGKFKTFFQMIAVIMLIINNYSIVKHVGSICLWVAAITAIWSCYNYMRQGFYQTHNKLK
ncbi:MAG: CDP-diacylglycerol--glycerol-3-phosphate 3-phosphatidyltransferase [Wolbachia endosymbiont of Xenopsylla cheopis]